MKEPSIIIECERTMRLRPPDIPVKRMPQLFGIFPWHHQDLGSPRIQSRRVIIVWTDNSGNESGFKIQRKQGATGTYADIANNRQPM